VRPFLALEEGPDACLVDLLGGADEPAAFAARVLAARTPPGPSASARLSRREHEVLLRLRSPSSLDEIADDLGVSVNTVKTHVRAIYVKLGVAGRRAAVVAAHHHGLLV
jgi:LuxR family transcriptional regulator, maltose regulon positive regulatory protein